MLLACYVFEWKPFIIFISYLVEIIIIAFIYSVVKVMDEKKNPIKKTNAQPIFNLLIGMVPLILFQFFIINVLSNSMDSRQDFFSISILHTKEFLYVVLSLILLYLLKIVQIRDNGSILKEFQSNLILEVLALTGTNILCVILVISLNLNTFIPVLSFMVLFRILLTIYFYRKINFYS